MKIYRVGMLGFGFMGKAHTFGYQTIPLYYGQHPIPIKLEAVCCRSRESVDIALREHGFAHGYTDIYEFFNKSNLDILHICTPNIFHKEALMEAIRRNIHVYCEKPLTINYEEATDVLQELEGKQLITQVVFHNRFFAPTIRAKQILSEGILGYPISFSAHYYQSSHLDKNMPVGWRQLPGFNGGVILDIGSHTVDMIYWMLGEFERVTAIDKTLFKKRPDGRGGMVSMLEEDEFMALAHMKNGADGLIHVSKITAGKSNDLCIEIFCENGAIKLDLSNPNCLEVYNHQDSMRSCGEDRGYKRIECLNHYPDRLFPSATHANGWLSGHVHCLYNFLCAIRDNKQANPSIKDGAYVMLILDRIKESAKNKQWVSI